MSEGTFCMAGPPEGWTPADIQAHMTKLGLKELPNDQARIGEFIAYEMEEGKRWGFDGGRLYYLRRLQNQYDHGYWRFENPGCPHCPGGGKPTCLLIYGTQGGYQTEQCGSAMIDYLAPVT